MDVPPVVVVVAAALTAMGVVAVAVAVAVSGLVNKCLAACTKRSRIGFVWVSWVGLWVCIGMWVGVWMWVGVSWHNSRMGASFDNDDDDDNDANDDNDDNDDDGSLLVGMYPWSL